MSMTNDKLFLRDHRAGFQNLPDLVHAPLKAVDHFLHRLLFPFPASSTHQSTLWTRLAGRRVPAALDAQHPAFVVVRVVVPVADRRRRAHFRLQHLPLGAQAVRGGHVEGDLQRGCAGGRAWHDCGWVCGLGLLLLVG